ncbi:MAG: aminotransferase class III-fold pyridoxal phosphate-dependent enzyme, partial [Chloroflexia bacterium]|nr:aminotransferase class III-fold pyridoxal phosphate-dependent enzyme [Chloroflexia bacterium]
SVLSLFAEFGGEIAAVILEPVAGNMGLVPPAAGFLEGLRDITRRHGALLIFDEVMTGFRVALGGATERYGVQPDLVALGKVVGGGFPLAAYAGPREIMEHVAPAGTMYQAGTLSGNPVATAAGIATLTILRQPGVFDTIEATAERLLTGLAHAARDAGVTIQTAHAGTMAGFFFNDQPVTNYREAATNRTTDYGLFFQAMLRRGVYLAPSQFEALFLSAAHTPADIDLTLEAASEAFREVATHR